METCVGTDGDLRQALSGSPLPVHASADGRCERSTLSGAEANFERYSQAGNASESKAFFSLLRETLLSVEAGNASKSKAFSAQIQKVLSFRAPLFNNFRIFAAELIDTQKE
jgi:hypothetical protein